MFISFNNECVLVGMLQHTLQALLLTCLIILIHCSNGRCLSTVWSQPGVVVPPPDDSDIQDYDYDYEENANASDV